MKTLKLVLKYKWFDMIESDVKKEEYRIIKPTITRLIFDIPKHYTAEQFTEQLKHNPTDPLLWQYLKPFEAVEFYRGYSKQRKIVKLKCKGIEIGKGKQEWGAEPDTDYFIIKLGNIL